jgi:predicted nicotinamide N-methyase
LADFLHLLHFSNNYSLLPELANASCILELGAGCGLASIALAKASGKKGRARRRVILSDFAEPVLGQLRQNVQLNFEGLEIYNSNLKNKLLKL